MRRGRAGSARGVRGGQPDEDRKVDAKAAKCIIAMARERATDGDSAIDLHLFEVDVEGSMSVGGGAWLEARRRGAAGRRVGCSRCG